MLRGGYDGHVQVGVAVNEASVHPGGPGSGRDRHGGAVGAQLRDRVVNLKPAPEGFRNRGRAPSRRCAGGRRWPSLGWTTSRACLSRLPGKRGAAGSESALGAQQRAGPLEEVFFSRACRSPPIGGTRPPARQARGHSRASARNPVGPGWHQRVGGPRPPRQGRTPSASRSYPGR
jgi:hypothetical protein